MQEGEIAVGLLFPADEKPAKAVDPSVVAIDDPNGEPDTSVEKTTSDQIHSLRKHSQMFSSGVGSMTEVNCLVNCCFADLIMIYSGSKGSAV